MHGASDRLAPLASPAFIAALALLVLNDFVLKPVFHNAVTGKLSDFAGLFALMLFGATLWPRRRRLAGCALATAFTFWKTSYANSLIASLNALLPFTVGRTVDLTDVIALPMIPLAVWAGPRLKPWPLPRMAQVGLAVLAPIAFTATSRIPYVARSTMDTSQAVVSEPLLQQFFDEIATRQGLRCEPCTPLSEGRTYEYPTSSSPEVETFRVRLDEPSHVLLFTAQAYERDGRRHLRALTADIRTGMTERFPDVAVIEVTTDEYYGELPESTIFVIRPPPDESARTTLSSIVKDVAHAHGLLTDERSGTFYAGDRVGSRPRERALKLVAAFETGTLFTVRVELRGPYYGDPGPDPEVLQRALIEDLATRLDAAFGHENVTRHAAPDPGRF